MQNAWTDSFLASSGYLGEFLMCGQPTHCVAAILLVCPELLTFVELCYLNECVYLMINVTVDTHT